MDDAGVDEGYIELRVDEDLVVGTVPSELLESSELLSDCFPLELGFFRRRSLKNGMVGRNDGRMTLSPKSRRVFNERRSSGGPRCWRDGTGTWSQRA